VKRYDVIVAGGGNAGLCAALSARDKGADVLLLERSPQWRRGGNSRHTRDIRYAHEHPDAWATARYSPSEFLDDLRGVSDELPHPELAELMVDESQTLPKWMEAHGVRWQRPMNGTLHLHTNRFFLGGGKAMVNTYYETARVSGVEVCVDALVTDLGIDGGRCTTVTYQSNGDTQTAATSAVVVSSGGLEANHEWLKQTWGPGAQNFIVRGTPDNDGSLLLRLIDQGAAPAGSNLFHCVAVDARSPRFDGGIVTRVDSIPFSVVVNRDGRRFYDEGEAAWPKRYAEWGRLIANEPDQIAYSIFDRQTLGLFIPPLFPPLEAASLEALALLAGLDPAAVVETVAEFNDAVDPTNPFDPSGVDGRCAVGLTPTRNNWARRIDQPPYYAYPMRPGLTFTYAGVQVDETARVMRATGGAFDNVFAAGEVMAGNILSRGYLAGVGLTIGSVFGRIAGHQAAHA
jgi:tricarballylate dehydrogenase